MWGVTPICQPICTLIIFFSFTYTVTREIIVGIYIRSDGACSMWCRAVIFSPVLLLGRSALILLYYLSFTTFITLFYWCWTQGYVMRWNISYSALFPSYTQIWCWVNNDFTNTAHLGPAPLCVCANVDGLPLQKVVKIANGFSLYFCPFVSCCCGGVGVGVVGVSLALCLHVLCGLLWMCSYECLRLVGGLHSYL